MLLGVNALFGLKKYLIAGVGITMLGMGAYIGILKYKNLNLEKSLVEVKFQNELLQEEVIVQKEIVARQLLADALSDDRIEEQSIETEDLLTLLEKINEFPESESCGVDPVLRDLLDRLSVNPNNKD